MHILNRVKWTNSQARKRKIYRRHAAEGRDLYLGYVPRLTLFMSYSEIHTRKKQNGRVLLNLADVQEVTVTASAVSKIPHGNEQKNCPTAMAIIKHRHIVAYCRVPQRRVATANHPSKMMELESCSSIPPDPQNKNSQKHDKFHFSPFQTQQRKPKHQKKKTSSIGKQGQKNGGNAFGEQQDNGNGGGNGIGRP